LLGDVDRARGIYEIAVAQQRLDMPEVKFSLEKFIRSAVLCSGVFLLNCTAASVPSKVYKCAAPPDNLRSDISHSRALPPF